MAFLLVTSLFFMWAIAHNLNDILIKQFQKALSLSRGEASFVQFAFYMAYGFAALPAGMAMRKFGFKRTILAGLGLYASGALLFYPAAEVRHYEFFLIALFIIASGIIFLETAGSGYITLTSPPGKAVRRINFSQSFNGLGSVVAPVIGGIFIFSGVEHTPEQLAALSSSELDHYQAAEARQVQGPYLAVATVVILIAALIWITPFAPSTRSNSVDKQSGVWSRLFAQRNFVWAVVAQFFYVGAQIGTWSYFIDFTKELTPENSEKTAAFFLSASLLSFMVGRFTGTFLLTIFAPRKILMSYASINILLLLFALFASGMPAVIALGVTSFFMSIMFPTIYALGLEDLGEEAEIGSSVIIMTIISGAFIPPAIGYLADATYVQLAYLVPLMCYAVVLFATKMGDSVSKATVEAAN